MYSFLNDYSEGAHPQILEALNQTNLIQTVGYGKMNIVIWRRRSLKNVFIMNRLMFIFFFVEHKQIC